MEELDEIIRILSKNKLKQIDSVVNYRDNETLEAKLYDLISNKHFESEEELAKIIFPDSSRKVQYLNRLKKKLQEKLYNSLFFIDFNRSNFSNIQRAYYTCHKNYALVKILIGRQSRKAAISLAQKTLAYSIKFEFTDLTVNLARILRLHFGTIAGDFKKSEKYNSLIRKYQKLLKAELIAEERYTSLASNYVKSRSSKYEIEEVAEKYETELRSLLEENESYNLILYSYYLFALRYQVVNDFENTLNVCREATRKLQKKHELVTKGALFVFNFYMLVCLKQFKKFQEGEKIAKACLNYTTIGTSNWFATLDNYFLLSLHSKQYQKAEEILLMVINHSQFLKLREQRKEIWTVNKAYIHFLRNIGKIKGTSRAKFRFGKFINEVPIFTKDKRGINISIIIIQILLHLEKKNFPHVIDKVDALNMYCRRYLKKDDTYRSNCFIKMLIQLPNANFNKIAAQRKAKKYFDKLLEVPIEKAKQSSEIEIIPYEDLWEFTLELLNKKSYKK